MSGRSVQFLWFDGCPLADRQRAELDNALSRLDEADRPTVEVIDIMHPDTSESLRRWGSPTILIDGRDVSGAPPGDAPGCRIYGEQDGVLPADRILTALVSGGDDDG